ncbi:MULTISPECIES: hypothetical protein [unclassified Caballeronia]|uniref:hypothetical protein n=1 Tax=unclassified Caballeronia TaxID=2646786 RepID=UPI000772390C|nr:MULTISPECIES: hypothetical protein [unclassified Caballeronia]
MIARLEQNRLLDAGSDLLPAGELLVEHGERQKNPLTIVFRGRGLCVFAQRRKRRLTRGNLFRDSFPKALQ